MDTRTERPDVIALTDRQRETLDWMKGYIREHGMPPTVREIGRAFGIKSSSVFDLLTALERKGHLIRKNRNPRSLVVAGMERPSARAADVPIVGRIAAGGPIEAIEDVRGSVTVGADAIRGGTAYALKVAGESMVEAGILDGDYVIVRKQETADDGDVVVALIGSDATLKRFFREKDGVRLEPANPGMAPIHVRSGEFTIQGKVVGVQRFLDSKVTRG
jgi:repressor LexA